MGSTKLCRSVLRYITFNVTVTRNYIVIIVLSKICCMADGHVIISNLGSDNVGQN